MTYNYKYMGAAKPLSFIAEVKQVTSKKTASMDMEYRAVLASEDPTVMSLGLLDADTLVKITVEIA